MLLSSSFLTSFTTFLVFGLLISSGEASAQTQTPLRVEAFGGVRAPLPPIEVPADLKPFVPQGFILRLVLQTNMSPNGEQLFLYDNGEDSFPEVHLHAIRHGRNTELFDEVVAAVAGILPIQAWKNKQVLSFAYHKGFDAADTQFMIFGAEKESYKVIFEGETTTGQMRILSESPLKFELWSADWKLDEGESCVWCPHRYRIQAYVFKSGKFSLANQQVTKAPLNPADVAGKTFVMARNRQ